MYLNANIIGLPEAAFEPQLVRGGEEVVMPGMGRAEMSFVYCPLLFFSGSIYVREKGLNRGSKNQEERFERLTRAGKRYGKVFPDVRI